MLVLEGGGIPFLNSLEMVVFVACRFLGGAGLVVGVGPGNGICVGGWNRVGLESCSGGILNGCLGGAGCVCCLRTQ